MKERGIDATVSVGAAIVETDGPAVAGAANEGRGRRDRRGRPKEICRRSRESRRVNCRTAAFVGYAGKLLDIRQAPRFASAAGLGCGTLQGGFVTESAANTGAGNPIPVHAFATTPPDQLGPIICDLLPVS